MQTAFEISRALSVAAFLFFGTYCLVSTRMVAEFDRYRLASFRILVGVLEISGALGLLASVRWPSLLPLSAGGLMLLMLLGVATRIRIRDTPVQTLPAAALGALNAFVLAAGVQLG